MRVLGRYLVVHYLPRVEAEVVERFEQLVSPPATARHLARMHMHLWRMALTDETYDLERVRSSLLRYGLTPGDLSSADDLLVRRLVAAIEAYGADSRAELHTEVAMALAAVTLAEALAPAA